MSVYYNEPFYMRHKKVSIPDFFGYILPIELDRQTICLIQFYCDTAIAAINTDKGGEENDVEK